MTTVVTAFDSATRNTGLLRRDSFPQGHALIIAPTNAVHTFFMRFAIDILFVAKDGTVVKICRAVRPWRIAIGVRAYAVIEMPAGTLAGCDLVAGDRLVLSRPV